MLGPDKAAVREANPIEQVIPALLGEPTVKVSVNEIAVRCPFHEDWHPSLRIHASKGVWRCDPCNRGGDVIAFVMAHKGLNFKAALTFLGERAGIRDDSARQIVTTYDYRDEQAELLYQTVRYEPKTFKQRRPDGCGGWTWNLSGTRRVVYRLPELKGREAVAIVEGEKDVDALWAIKVPATCNVCGSGKWRDEYAEQLKAAGVLRVAVVPDNDAPGRTHAETVAQSCDAAGLSVRLLTLPDGVRDVSGFLNAHSRDALIALIQQAPAWTPPSVSAGASDARPDGSSAPPEEHIGPRLVCLADVEPEEVRWLWPGRFACGKFTLLIGDPGLGKSFLTLDVAARVSRGAELPNGGGGVEGGVVLLSAEDGIADTIRVRAGAMGATLQRLHCLEAIYDPDGERFFSLDRDLPALEQAVAQTDACLVIIDPLSAYLGGGTDSYKDAEVRRVIALLTKLAERLGIAVVGVAHLTKSADRKAIHRSLGSVAFAAAARTVLAVAKDPDDELRRFLVAVKNNLGPEPPALAYRLVDGRVEWEPDAVCGLHADQLLGVVVNDGEGHDAVTFLQEELADGPVPSETLLKASNRVGISSPTLRRAKQRLGIESQKCGFGASGKWSWSLPPKVITEDGSSPKMLTSPEVITLGADPAKTVDFTDADAKVITSPDVSILDGPVTDAPPPRDGAERF